MKKIAFVFPGQGSQAVGMLSSWQGNTVVTDVIDRASTALNQDIQALMANGPAEELNLTTNTQPVMLVASYAMYEAWLQAGGVKPELMAGHSLGEYTALTAAGMFTLEDAVRLVRIRADAMQKAVPVGTGGMAAIIGLDDDTVRQVCEQASQDNSIVEPVNFNAPSQVVIAGNTQALERACQLAKEAGAKRALPLPVSAPFHSTLLKPVADVLKQAMATLSLKAPTIDVVNNVDVQINTSVDAICDALQRQAWHPVQWVKTIQFFKAQGVTHIVECGPGKVLAGLVKRIDSSLIVLNINDPASLEATQQALV